MRIIMLRTSVKLFNQNFGIYKSFNPRWVQGLLVYQSE